MKWLSNIFNTTPKVSRFDIYLQQRKEQNEALQKNQNERVDLMIEDRAQKEFNEWKNSIGIFDPSKELKILPPVYDYDTCTYCNNYSQRVRSRFDELCEIEISSQVDIPEIKTEDDLWDARIKLPQMLFISRRLNMNL